MVRRVHSFEITHEMSKKKSKVLFKSDYHQLLPPNLTSGAQVVWHTSSCTFVTAENKNPTMSAVFVKL